MTFIVRNLKLLRDRITTACFAANRPAAEVRLLAVSKTFGADAVIEAVSGGQRAFGENYIAEGVEKILALRDWQHAQALAPDPNNPNATGTALINLEWHCIGPVQSNKTRLVAEHFDWVQSVDRLKIAERLNEQRPAHLPALQICLQVNADGGANKSGLAPEDVLAMVKDIAKLPRLVLRGFMAIPEPAPDFSAACAVHAKMKLLFDTVNSSGFLPVPMDTLSLGMTGDLEAAIHSGSTMVRVGTGIFGGR